MIQHIDDVVRRGAWTGSQLNLRVHSTHAHLRMSETNFYVYALKYPRADPARPFYVGKGTGTRAYDHRINPDAFCKGQVIREIVAAGYQ